MSELMLDVGQANELKLAFRRYGWSNSQIKSLTEKEDILKEFREVLEGTMRIVPAEFFINVDRSLLPVFPYWAKALYPKLQTTGPAKFDVGKVEQWLHHGQKNGRVEGAFIHGHLKKHGMLGECLGLQDLGEIQKQGAAFFRRFFQEKTVFGWKSIVQNCGGALYVPYLLGDDCEVMLCWRGLDSSWYAQDLVLRFAS